MSWAIGIAAAVQAFAAIAIVVLTKRLSDATTKYAADTQRMAEEMERRREQEDMDRRRTHAEQLSAWVENFRGPTQGALHGVLVMYNGGDQPAYDVRVTLRLENWTDEISGKRVLPPRTRHEKTDWVMRQQVALTPGQTINVGDVTVELEFRDVTGRRWKRENDGRLAELEDGV